jgi:hypothetical protein
MSEIEATAGEAPKRTNRSYRPHQFYLSGSMLLLSINFLSLPPVFLFQGRSASANFIFCSFICFGAETGYPEE